MSRGFVLDSEEDLGGTERGTEGRPVSAGLRPKPAPRKVREAPAVSISKSSPGSGPSVIAYCLRSGPEEGFLGLGLAPSSPSHPYPALPKYLT